MKTKFYYSYKKHSEDLVVTSEHITVKSSMYDLDIPTENISAIISALKDSSGYSYYLFDENV
jgi:hypothetical protein